MSKLELMGLLLITLIPGPFAAYFDYKLSFKLGRTLIAKTERRVLSIFLALMVYILLINYLYTICFNVLIWPLIHLTHYGPDLVILLAFIGLGGIGTLLTLLFGLFYIGRLIFKLRQIELGIPYEKNLKTIIITIVSIFILVLLPSLTWNTVLLASHYKPFAEAFVMFDLKYSCFKEKKGCDELRPLPTYLQGKKIVVDDTSFVRFEPYYQEADKEVADLDVSGFIDIDDHNFNYDFVTPTSNRMGYLANKEYAPVRAVYHYNCSYCIDSSDDAYIVVEDKDKNRFIVPIDNHSTTTVAWDEQPLLLPGKGWRLVPVQ